MNIECGRFKKKNGNRNKHDIARQLQKCKIRISKIIQCEYEDILWF